MANIATVLKAEISRVARKEVRAETTSLKKAGRLYRSEIAALKRTTQTLERQIKKLLKTNATATQQADAETSETPRRFGPKSLISQRRRLGLSAAECGLLLGASSQSIYNWEEGKTRPQAKHLPAIAALRALGKRQAAAHLESLRQAT